MRTYHLDTRPVPLETSRVALHEVGIEEYGALYRLVTVAEATSRWRFRGSTPSPEDFRDLLWRGVIGQFAVTRRSDRSLIGLVTAFDADFPNATTHLAVLFDPRVHGLGWPLEGVVLFINYVFEHWPFRKLYAESIEFNATTYVRGARRLFVEEGRLGQHEYYQGRYWDVYLLALYRERWEEYRTRYRSILEPRTETRPGDRSRS